VAQHDEVAEGSHQFVTETSIWIKRNEMDSSKPSWMLFFYPLKTISLLIADAPSWKLGSVPLGPPTLASRGDSSAGVLD
jgi:hypothetical protein